MKSTSSFFAVNLAVVESTVTLCVACGIANQDHYTF